ncbi:MAG: hypothetical protein ABF899_01500 [Oenococcus sp.]
MTALLIFMTGFSFAATVAGVIVFAEIMRRSGKGSIWKGLKKFWNGY